MTDLEPLAKLELARFRKEVSRTAGLPSGLTRLEKTVLSTLSSTGRYMRLKRLGGAPKSVVLGLVLDGYVKRDENKRFRITGRGFGALYGD